MARVPDTPLPPRMSIARVAARLDISVSKRRFCEEMVDELLGSDGGELVFVFRQGPIPLREFLAQLQDRLKELQKLQPRLDLRKYARRYIADTILLGACEVRAFLAWSRNRNRPGSRNGDRCP